MPPSFWMPLRAGLESERTQLEQRLTELRAARDAGSAKRAPAVELSLGEVRAALARMDTGTYGKCTRCRDAIPEADLQAHPTARLCHGCAGKSVEADEDPSEDATQLERPIFGGPDADLLDVEEATDVGIKRS